MIWTNFPSSLLRQQWLWRFRGNHHPGAHLPMYWQNIHCLCTPVLGLVGAAAAHKAKSWGECSLTLPHKALNDASHTYDTVRVWRYDKAEWNSLITRPPPASSHAFLSSCLAHTLTCSLCPAATYTCPHCWRSVAFQRWRNGRPMSCGENG